MTYEAVRTLTLKPVTANVINARRFVNVVDTTDTVDESTAAGDAVGVSMFASAAADSEVIAVALLDGAKMEVEAGAAFAVGDRLMSDATGRAIAATGATARVLGRALEASGAAGQIVTIVGQKDAGEFVA